MRFEIPCCPECGKPACKVTETIVAVASLTREDDGSFAYAGGSDVCWDTQETYLDENDEATLGCENGHEWQSELTAPVTCECGVTVAPNDPYFATPCGTHCEACFEKHRAECEVCDKEF